MCEFSYLQKKYYFFYKMTKEVIQVNMKAFALVFVVIFATVAIIAVQTGLSAAQSVEKSVDSGRLYRIVQLGGVTVEPQEEIDTPAMPG
jgi:hypothetical protein